MNERDKILGRIREALRVPVPPPVEAPAHPKPASQNVLSPSPPFRQWLPRVGSTFEERLEMFRQNAVNLKADFYFMDAAAEFSQTLTRLSSAANWKKLASHHGPLTDAACRVLGLPVCFVDGGYDVRELEQCDVGITECDALVAQTGSVLVTSRSAGGRALSVLPPHHLVLARRDQLVGDLSDAFEVLKQRYASNYPSLISFITGPSRTGDIERILVLGAHGPKRLTILCS